MNFKAAGSNQEYWRDDNPLIRLWLRFGDDLPVNNFLGDTPEDHFSGLMTDSSTSRGHLMHRGSSFVTSIGTPVSGLAPWSVSGIEFNGSSWVDGAHAGVLGFYHAAGHPGTDQQNNPHFSDDGAGTGARGSFQPGGETEHSGICVMGWAQFEAPTETLGAFRPVIGNWEIGTATTESQARGGPGGQWQIFYAGTHDGGDSNILMFALGFPGTLTTGGTNNSPFLNLSARSAAVDNTATPFPVPIGEPFFFAFTYHRELHPETQTPAPLEDFNIDGSGILKMYLGTTVSGLTLIKEHPIVGPDLRAQRTPEGQNMYAIGNRPENLRSATDSFGLTQDSILDEVVVVLDGYMTEDRIAHYMNSGILTFPENNPERPEFAPQAIAPEDPDLNIYLKFDDDDGINSAPLTSGALDFIIGSADTFLDGIRGGRALQINSVNTNSTFDFGPADVNSFTSLPIGSGRNTIFPDINRSRGMTWLGWVLTQTNVNDQMWWPSIGFVTNRPIGAPNGALMFWGGETITGVGHDDRTTFYDYEGHAIKYFPSGSLIGDTRLATYGSAGGHNLGPRRTAWHFLAIVFDFDAGLIYHVKDAKHIIIDTQILSPASGISDEFLLNNVGFSAADRTTQGSEFVFARTQNNVVGLTTAMAVDEWAFFDRVLTLPEMSGFALSGVVIPPILSPINTSFKRTYGYWKFDQNSEEIFDPTGVSGLRYNDSSWYRHHLTNVSGQFSISANFLNDNVGEESLRVDVSGSMLGVSRIDHGSILDQSSSKIFATSGFSCGAWIHLPSGDLETEGNGSSGLFGTHHIMGAWSQETSEQSWQLAIVDNKLSLSVVPSGFSVDSVVASEEVPFATDFFVFGQAYPSGGAIVAELYTGTDPDTTTDFRLIGRNTSITNSALLQRVSISGFTLLNVPNRQQGFPSGTRIQGAFMYGGHFIAENIGDIKRAVVTDTALGSGAVSATDPANISHWKFDEQGAEIPDFGREQNILNLINTDGHGIGVERSIHGSGIIIREPEYLDTLPSNPNTRRLDLGSGNSSWTVLSWIRPAVTPSNTTLNNIVTKSSQQSGVQIFTGIGNQILAANAASKTTTTENGAMAPGEWSHMAVVFDRDNNEFTTIINGRYAGPAFDALDEVPVNNSGFVVGGRGDVESNALLGGPGFSGVFDDMIVFERALTLPEISGLAANTYNFDDGSTIVGPAIMGGYISGLGLATISGLIGYFLHGQAQDIELIGGYVSGVEGLCIPYGGYMRGKAFASGIGGHFMHGLDAQSGVFGHFVHGLDIVSGFLGSYEFGACTSNDEFDITLNFSVITSKDFDARLGVEKTEFIDFDARLGVIHITQPPGCTLEMPAIGTIVSGTPFTLTVQGSGFAFEDKSVEKVRFTFADFKGAETGTLVGGSVNSGLFEASRVYDTPGFYNVKIEILDSFGYRASCVRPFLLIPSGTPSGVYLNSLPGISISGTPKLGSTIHTVSFTHSLSGLDTTSGLLEYTDFADQQESLVNSLEMPVGTQFIDFIRRHDYTMPGRYTPVWAVSGEFGVVSDSISDGIDYLI